MASPLLLYLKVKYSEALWSTTCGVGTYYASTHSILSKSCVLVFLVTIVLPVAYISF